jgi:hypothetical protein
VPVEIIVPLAHEPEMRVRPMDARRKFEEAPFSQVAERRYYTRARLVPKPKKVDGRID